MEARAQDPEFLLDAVRGAALFVLGAKPDGDGAGRTRRTVIENADPPVLVVQRRLMRTPARSEWERLVQRERTRAAVRN